MYRIKCSRDFSTEYGSLTLRVALIDADTSRDSGAYITSMVAAAISGPIASRNNTVRGRSHLCVLSHFQERVSVNKGVHEDGLLEFRVLWRESHPPTPDEAGQMTRTKNTMPRVDGIFETSGGGWRDLVPTKWYLGVLDIRRQQGCLKSNENLQVRRQGNHRAEE